MKKILVILTLIFPLLFACTHREVMYCGFDDGPFVAIPTDSVAHVSESTIFDLTSNGSLHIDNRTDSLSPLITLYEEGQVKWSLAMDLADWTVDRIYDVEISDRKKLIKLSFIASWSFGNEVGTMRIDRATGDNNYCLSW